MEVPTELAVAVPNSSVCAFATGSAWTYASGVLGKNSECFFFFGGGGGG